MAHLASPGLERIKDTRKRLESCWEVDLSWKKYTKVLENVSIVLVFCFFFFVFIWPILLVGISLVSEFN